MPTLHDGRVVGSVCAALSAQAVTDRKSKMVTSAMLSRGKCNFFKRIAVNVIHSGMSLPGGYASHRRVAGKRFPSAGDKSQQRLAMTEGIMMNNVLKKCHAAGILACLSLTTGGCSSVMTHTGPSQGYYPGTRASAEVLADGDSSWVMKPLAAIDLPFSAVLDTLLLPWDYLRTDDVDSPRERVRRSEQANRTAEGLAQAAPLAISSPPQ